MTDIPTFKLFGEDDPDFQSSLRPDIGYRDWSDLSIEERTNAFKELIHSNILNLDGDAVIETIKYLNYNYLSLCPGKNLHNTPRIDNRGRWNRGELKNSAYKDFTDIFIEEKSSEIVMLMLSKFVKNLIRQNVLERAQQELDTEKKEELIKSAYAGFDRGAKCLNHIFQQFSIRWEVTRGAFVPRQDVKISELIYQPTLEILSDPKWQSVNSDLSKMFDDFQNAKYSECIAKAHSAVQRFLQVIVGEEGKNGKGNFGQLFSEAKMNGLISFNQFTEPVINAIQRYIPSERANNSTAKPAVKEATYSDALLMMNVVMILLQHCLQNLNHGTKTD
ncbi:MAG: hypothetical protein ABJN57_05465 [Hyphomicrobiales bacterium]